MPWLARIEYLHFDFRDSGSFIQTDPQGFNSTSGHLTVDVVYARPDWTVTEAAAAMVRGGFRHLVVLDGDDVLGVISVRDILRVWSQQQVAA